ncbi:hypothetical protein Pmani_018510 [Petrolisthes manimaculis]|uniref:Uncharacterized protein n=1 Tax=Petrolisthes manimaculis TaxID=1843537 RepID=A0AAE1PJM1_9EUCA|nr:hypothetical protein Pmani_018510 [Petrolisthes manimaculis]
MWQRQQYLHHLLSPQKSQVPATKHYTLARWAMSRGTVNTFIRRTRRRRRRRKVLEDVRRDTGTRVWHQQQQQQDLPQLLRLQKRSVWRSRAARRPV